MSSTLPDHPPAPIAKLTRLRRTTIASGTVVITVTAVWALLPLPAVDTPTIALGQFQPKQAVPNDVEFNLAAFDAPIWVTPPPAKAMSKQEEQPAPLPARITLELVVIELDGEALRAAFYDQHAMKLVTAAAGETISGHVVVEITREEVKLTIGEQAGVLKLRNEPPPAKLKNLERRIESRSP